MLNGRKLTSWGRFEEHCDATQRVVAQESGGNSCIRRFQYPNKPYSIEITRLLNTLPGGIAEICLSGSISLPVLTLAVRMATWNRQTDNTIAHDGTVSGQENRQNAALCIRIWQTLPLNLVEKFFVLACTAYCIHRGREMETWWATHAFVQMSCLAINTTQICITLDHPTLLIWTARVLQETFGKENPPWTLANRLLIHVAAKHPIYTNKLDSVLQGYFWDD